MQLGIIDIELVGGQRNGQTITVPYPPSTTLRLPRKTAVQPKFDGCKPIKTAIDYDTYDLQDHSDGRARYVCRTEKL